LLVATPRAPQGPLWRLARGGLAGEPPIAGVAVAVAGDLAL
jgi:hypothetical protein